MMRINRPLLVAVPVALLLGFAVVWRSPNHQSAVESARPLHVHPLLTRSVLPPAPQAVPAAIADAAASEPAKPRERAGQFAAFNSWTEKYLASGTPALKEALIEEGEALAQARREEMLNLIRTDPARALAQAAPYRLRKQLPASIVSRLEEPVSGRGELTFVQATPLPGHEKDVRTEFHRVELNHKTYEAYVYGRRKEQFSRRGLALHGVAVGNALALSADPVRILASEEAQDLFANGAVRPEAICSMTGQALAGTGGQTWGDFGGKILNFCQPEHVKLLNNQFAAAESEIAFAGVNGSSTTLPPPGGSSTEGTKTLLLIPATFMDDPRPPISPDGFAAVAHDNNQYFNDGSYGTVSFLTTITPVVRLPQRKEYYSEFLSPDLWSDARAAALALGYDASQYQFHYVLFNPIPGVYFGGRSDFLLNGAAGALSHELGHNFTLGHANFWDTRGNAPLPPQPPPPVGPYPFDPDSLLGHADINAPALPEGTNSVVEYGNNYDVMGSGGGHFSAFLKNQIKWLPDQTVPLLAASATNRIYAFDTPRIQEGRLYALRFRKNATRTYWASYRQGFPNNPWLSSGIELLWNAMLLDTTPGSLPGKNDAAIVVGRTFTDPECDFNLTPIAKGGEGLDKWIDVVVQVGPFPTNVAPTLSITSSDLVVTNGATVTFTATASDTNGDALAYYWNFGDETFGANSATNIKTFFNTGYYVVRCEASDMKGGLASAQLLVTVGNPTNFTMSGRVIDSSGNGLQGVRVHNSGIIPANPTLPQDGTPPPPLTNNNATYRYTYTDSDGYYTIANLPVGTYTNRAFIYGYRTEPLNFNDPVTLVDAGASGLDHLAIPLTKVMITVRSNAVEGPNPISGQFTFTRVGATNLDLPVLFEVSGDELTGAAVPDVNYTSLSTNMPATNIIVIRAGDYSTNLAVLPINDQVGDGPKTVTVTLLLQPTDMRISESITNIITTNNMVLYTNSMIVYTTNIVTIPGWEALPRGPDNQLTWFQTDPTYVLGTSEATMTIRDDDKPANPTVLIAALDSDAVETGNDSAVLVFTRVLGTRAMVEGDLEVTFKAGGGTAVYGVDYAPLSSSITNKVTIRNGQSFAIVPIYALNDLYVEGNETEVFTVLSSTNYNGAGSSATIYIIDDDLPLVSVYASDSVAGKAGNPGTMTFSRAGDLESDLLVNYLVQEGSAVSGVDYQTLPGSVVIPAGQIFTDVTIQPINNTNSTGAKTVTVLISDSTTYNIVGLGQATVTIRDILPEVTLAVTTATANESGAAGLFTVSRSGPDTNNSLVVYFLVGGSAVENSDYSPIGTNVVIPAGASSATIRIAPIQDPFKEFNEAFPVIGGGVVASRRVNEHETVIVQLVGGPDYNLGAPTAGEVVIEDDDVTELSAIGFMSKSSSGREDSGFAVLPLFISANTATNRNPAVVDYRITSGSAIQGLNYSFVGTAQIIFSNYVPVATDFTAPLQQIEFIEIPLLNDGQASGDKTFTITLFHPAGYDTNYVTNTMTMLVSTNLTKIPTNAFLADYRSHTFTIIDVGVTRIGIQAIDSLAYETGEQPAAFRITRTGGSTAKALTVRFSVAGTATSGSDYLPLGNSITIPAGANAVNFLLTPIDDPAEEYAESVIVTLLNSPGLTVDTPSATAIIVDNDGTIQFTAASYAESEGATNALVSVQRTGDTNLVVTVDYSATDGTALSGPDFTATNGTLSFGPGEVLKYITIPLINDSVVELTETVSLVLTNATGGIPLGGQVRAMLSILDDDSAFDFTASGFEVNENVPNATISVRRTGLTNFTGTVDFMTIGGSAKTNLDYYAVTNTLTFAPGVATRTVLVPILDDFVLDGDQTVDMLLANASANTAAGTNSTAQLVIVDDECKLEFAEAAISVNEYAGLVTLDVRRVGGTVHPVSVNFATTNGTATNVVDYLRKSGKLDFRGDQFVQLSDGSGQLEFRKGETNKLVTIVIVDDVIGEVLESFGVNLTNAIITGLGAQSPGVTLGMLSLATVSIIDNETPGNVDYEFNPGLGANDTVFSVAVQPSLKVLLGGKFTGVDGLFYGRIARLEANGHLDNSFNPGSGANDIVRVVVSQPDGKVLLGGEFTRVDNTDRNSIARLNADGDLDSGFKPGLGANKMVRAIALQADGKVIIGGDFTQVDGRQRSRLARLHPDGRLDNSFAPVANNPVYALAVQPDGKILLGGAFTSVSGGDRFFVARLDTNGLPDTTFNPAQGPSARVNTLALQADGKIVIGGEFLSVNGTNWNYLGRLLTNGLPDASFAPGSGPNRPVNSLSVQPNGKIVIGGEFTNYNTVSRQRFARLRPDGALDMLFNPGSGANDVVQSVAVQTDSAIILGGDFTQVFDLPRNRIARIHGDEKSDLFGVEFSAATYTISEGVPTTSILVQRTGSTNRAFDITLLITNGTATLDQDYKATGGPLSFRAGELSKSIPITILEDSLLEPNEEVCFFLTNALPGVDMSGIVVAKLIIIDNEKSFFLSATNYNVSEGGTNVAITVERIGALDGDVAVSLTTSDGTAEAPADYTSVSNYLQFASGVASMTVSIDIYDDDLVEGDQKFNVLLSHLVGDILPGRTNATVTIKDNEPGPGGVDRTFDPGVGGDLFVRAVTVQADNKVLVGGGFTSWDGTNRNHITRLNTNGTHDLTFNPGLGADALVSAVVTMPDGRIMLGGSFSNFNGAVFNHVVRLNTNGSLDIDFTGKPGFNASVNTITVQTNGRTVVGGGFSLPLPGAVRLRANGTVDTSFNMGVGADGPVYCAGLFSDGRVVIGGAFTKVNGSSRTRVAVLLPNGLVDQGFIPPVLSSGTVYGVAVQTDGRLIIVGDFNVALATNCHGVARLNMDGSLDTSFDPGTGANQSVFAVGLQANGKVVVAGDFTTINRTNRIRFARLTTTGSVDTGFDPGLGANNTVYSLAIQPDNHIILGGDFSKVNGFTRSGVARVIGRDDDELVISYVLQGGQPGHPGEIVLIIGSQPGRRYVLDASLSLPNWMPLRTNTASGVTLEFTEPIDGSTQKFFRVRRLEP